MDQSTLVTELNTFFQVSEFSDHSFWEAQPKDYRLMVNRYMASNFVEDGGNGLMLDNTTQVERVYLAVFPSQAVLDKVIAREIERDAPGALIFTHHPAAYDPLKGYVRITEAQLADLHDQNISLYVCHAPLQRHREISTAGALANALRLREQVRFADLAGVWGYVKSMSFQAFVQRLARVCETPLLRYDQIAHNGLKVERVAFVPGSDEYSNIIEFIDEALGLGCDTFVCGQWWPYAEAEWAEIQRVSLSDRVTTLRMNLLGIGHYHSELVVMRDQMQEWFKQLGIDTQLLREPEQVKAE